MPVPTVSIGMPVYNGEQYIRAAIESVLTQTWRDFELTISDNASTDGTESICREYAAADARIRYVRQPENLGASGNFRFVLHNACAEYFMWAAVDDLRSPDFLAANLAFLQSHPEYLGSTSPVRFSGGEFDALKMGDASLDESDPNDRVIKPFSVWHANGHFYALFRRSAVMNWRHIEKMDFLGADWTLVTHLASNGKLNRHTEGWVELGTEGFSSNVDIYSKFRTRWIHWLLPFHTVNCDTLAHLRRPSLRQLFTLLKALAILNYQAARQQLFAWRLSRL